MFRFSKALATILMACLIVPAAHAAETQPAKSAVTDDYVIGPGDEVQVYVWQNPELTLTVPVRPDGKISTPLVEDMVAIGKTPSILARDIEGVLSEFVKTPRVNVIVTNPTSVFSQVRVVGQVREQQAVPYREGMTVMDAVLAAGGLAEFAAPNRSKLIRTENGKEVQIPVRVKRLFDGDMKQNLKLRPGDVLVIPQSRF